MTPRVIQVTHIRDFVLRIRFSDGREGDIDLGGELDGEIFAPLRVVSYFKKVSVHPELHTLIWPNGADFAPEFLYDLLKVPA